MAGMLVGYARCSTGGQDLTAQRDALAALGVKPKRIYVDHGLTGTNRARPGLREALAACRSGDTLVVTKLDRLARSVPDARDIVEELTANGIRLNIGGSVHDPTDPVGRLLFTTLSMIAEFESDLIRMRTREGMKVAKAKGRLRGKQPKLKPAQEAHLVELWRAGNPTSAELAELFAVARSTVYRAVQLLRIDPAAGSSCTARTEPTTHAEEQQVAEHFPPATRMMPPRMLVGFQITKQHRRFVEFADAVRRHRYIGVCYGAPGLGKTLSARTYACADDWERWDNERHEKGQRPAGLFAGQPNAGLHTRVHVTGRRMHMEIALQASALGGDIDQALDPNCHPSWTKLDTECSTELVIVDEADRLRTAGLEQLRDFFDRRDLGLILIGMPGFDRQLARYPQLYSRIGSAHQYKPLDVDDLPLVLTNYWDQLGLPLDPDDTNDFETVSAVVRITGGNFRLIERLMTQVARVMEINQLEALDPDVIHAGIGVCQINRCFYVRQPVRVATISG